MANAINGPEKLTDEIKTAATFAFSTTSKPQRLSKH